MKIKYILFSTLILFICCQNSNVSDQQEQTDIKERLDDSEAIKFVNSNKNYWNLLKDQLVLNDSTVTTLKEHINNKKIALKGKTKEERQQINKETNLKLKQLLGPKKLKEFRSFDRNFRLSKKNKAN